jgi:hypothetical protein
VTVTTVVTVVVVVPVVTVVTAGEKVIVNNGQLVSVGDSC